MLHSRERSAWDRPPQKLTALDRVLLTCANYGGVCIILGMLVAVTWTLFNHTCPTLYPKEESDFCTSSFPYIAAFLLSQMLLNLALFHVYAKQNEVSHWQRSSRVASLCKEKGNEERPERQPLRRVDSNGSGQETLEMEDIDYGKWCVDCMRTAPTRSHHCPLCRHCVLRKDHHCFVTGGCVGLGNQRYFIVFVFWATMGCGYAAYLLAAQLNAELESWYPFGWWKWIAPVAVVRWMFFGAPLYQMGLCTALSFMAACCIGALAFFVMQIFYTLHGYTMYEYHSLSIREAYEGDGDGIGERMRLVFGQWYLLNFLFPMFWCKQRLTAKISDNLFRVRSKLL